jgi:hypothetical protein
MSKSQPPQTTLTQTLGDHGIRFAGPDLLDYQMNFNIHGGEYDGHRLFIYSYYHPCCGTLEVNASLADLYVRWRNKLDGCKMHTRDQEGDKILRDLVCNLMINTNPAENED